MDDIFDVLKREHRQARALFDRIEKACEDGKPIPTDSWERLRAMLEQHAQGEEAVFYPALKDAAESRETTLEALVEHRHLKELVDECERMPGDSDAWHAPFHVLKEYVDLHVREEEGMLFPEARKVLEKDRQLDLATAYLAAKTRASVPR